MLKCVQSKFFAKNGFPLRGLFWNCKFSEKFGIFDYCFLASNGQNKLKRALLASRRGEQKSKTKILWLLSGGTQGFYPQKIDIIPKPKDLGCWVGENNVIVLQVIAPWDLEVWLKTYILLVKVIICKYDRKNILVKIKLCTQMKWYTNFEGRTVILDWLYLYELSEYSPLYNAFSSLNSL